MATAFPYFGDAVHAVLSFMQAGGDPLALNDDQLQQALKDHMAHPEVYTPDQLARIRDCWCYVADLTRHAAWVEYEPVSMCGLSSDILLGSDEVLCILEIKTFEHRFDAHSGLPTKLLKSYGNRRRLYTQRAIEQIDALINDVWGDRASFPQRRILGVVVRLYGDLHRPFEPEYKIVRDVQLPPP